MGAIELNFTFFIQLANFLVTLVVLNYLLIKPIREHIKNRKGLVEGYLHDVERFTASAQGKLDSYEKSLDEARSVAAVTRDQLKADAHQREHDLITTAQSDAQNFIRASKEETAKQAAKTLADLKKQIPAFADQVVSRILQ